eukprot:1193755-Prorocentrum_minimum.AAC.3
MAAEIDPLVGEFAPQDRFRDSPYDTAVFFLQNEEGAAQWPVRQEVLEELKVSEKASRVTYQKFSENPPSVDIDNAELLPQLRHKTSTATSHYCKSCLFLLLSVENGLRTCLLLTDYSA